LVFVSTVSLAAAVTALAFLSPGPAEASSTCNPTKALNLLRQGQVASVDGNKKKAVAIQMHAAVEAWICYQDQTQSARVRGTMGKAAAHIANGAAQDAEAVGDDRGAVKLAKLALTAYKTIARDRSLPLDIRTYADGAVEAATSP